MTLEESILQIVNRPGSVKINAKEVATRLQAFSGNSSEIMALGEGNIVGIRPDNVVGTKQMIQGTEREVYQVPVLMWAKGAAKPTWKIVSLGALLRTTADVPAVGSILNTQVFTSDAAFLAYIHAHVGDGDEEMTAIPAKSIRVDVTPLVREFNGVERTVKYHSLYLLKKKPAAKPVVEQADDDE